jgi:serine protease Do
MRNKKLIQVIGAIAAIIILSFGAGIGGAYALRLIQPQTNLLIQAGDGNKVATTQEAAIASVVQEVSPSVVSIVTQVSRNSYYGVINQEGAGTGIIISKDGYIMTNHHVLEGASDVSVITSSGQKYENVKVIGNDPLNDIAFLKINSNDTFTAAELGDSSTVRIGQQVVAIGNALGQYQNTVTSGIISGTGRPVTATTGNGSAESLTDLMQTDASINPGNSGGPLVNLSGQVVGMNTAVANNADGIGFAIPINSTKGVLQGVLENGKVSRAYLGVAFLSITPDVAEEYDLPVNEGAYIYSESGTTIVKGSPAEKAGIKSGDIIQKINDQTVGRQGALSTLIGQYRPGGKVTLTILRGGETIQVDVQFSEFSS